MKKRPEEKRKLVVRGLPDAVDAAQFAAVVQRLEGAACPVCAWYFVPGESTRPEARTQQHSGRTARAYVQLQRAADVPRAAELLGAEQFAVAPGAAERVAGVVEYAPYQMMVPPDSSNSSSSSSSNSGNKKKEEEEEEEEDKGGEKEARALFGDDAMFEAFLEAKARNFHTAEAPEAAPGAAETAPLVVELAELRDAGELKTERGKKAKEAKRARAQLRRERRAEARRLRKEQRAQQKKQRAEARKQRKKQQQVAATAAAAAGPADTPSPKPVTIMVRETPAPAPAPVAAAPAQHRRLTIVRKGQTGAAQTPAAAAATPAVVAVSEPRRGKAAAAAAAAQKGKGGAAEPRRKLNIVRKQSTA